MSRWPRTVLRRRRQYLRDVLEDLRRFLRGTRDPDLPPVRLRFVGAGDFREQGAALLRLLVDVGGLRPSDRVLDIGCGAGRVAMPLTGYLSPSGTYDGMDPVKPAIRWCQRRITSRHPTFRFTHVDVYNSFYHRRGELGTTFRFPYADGAFTFAFATSVFTHLVPEVTRNYLGEAHRVVRSGGTLLATFFLRDVASDGAAGERDLEFPHRRDGHALQDPEVPDAAICYDLATAEELLDAAGWRLTRLEPGAWRGRVGAPSYQDTLVVERIDVRATRV